MNRPQRKHLKKLGESARMKIAIAERLMAGARLALRKRNKKGAEEAAGMEAQAQVLFDKGDRHYWHKVNVEFRLARPQ